MSSPARSLNRQYVLEEDEYTAALSEIIARDFFPSLSRLDTTNSYLGASQSRDSQHINDTIRRLQDLSTPATSGQLHITPGRTPYGEGPSDTPIRKPPNENQPNKRPRYDTSLSLDAFQARYTSEDNASFTELLDDENRKRKEKWAWAWDAQKRATHIKAIESEKRSHLLLEDTLAQPVGVRERLSIEMPQVKLIVSGVEGGDTEDSGQSNESGSSSTALVKAEVKIDNSTDDVLASRKDNRPAGVDGWAFKARNPLMFAPDADQSPYDTATSLPSNRQQKGLPKSINYKNTRLPEQSNEDGGISGADSPTRSTIEAAISGTPYVPRGDREEFPLLPAVPSPTPSQLGSDAVNKLMTWGVITGTPRILASDDMEPVEPPSTPFRLVGPTPRERAAQKLSSSASRSLRAKASLLSGTPLPRSLQRESGINGILKTPRPHADMLTPAARRLLDRTRGLGISASRRADAMRCEANWEGKKAKNLTNVRWTPSPVTRKNT